MQFVPLIINARIPILAAVNSASQASKSIHPTLRMDVFHTYIYALLSRLRFSLYHRCRNEIDEVVVHGAIGFRTGIKAMEPDE